MLLYAIVHINILLRIIFLVSVKFETSYVFYFTLRCNTLVVSVKLSMYFVALQSFSSCLPSVCNGHEEDNSKVIGAIDENAFSTMD